MGLKKRAVFSLFIIFLEKTPEKTSKFVKEVAILKIGKKNKEIKIQTGKVHRREK